MASEVQLYVGTELGIYFKKGANNWIPFNTGLPNVQIGEIEIYYNNTNTNLSKFKADYIQKRYNRSVKVVE